MSGAESESVKKIIATAACLLLTACQTRTDYGKCVGLGEKQNPKLEYQLSTRNIVWGIIGIELVVPPVVVVTQEIFCPIGEAP